MLSDNIVAQSANNVHPFDDDRKEWEEILSEGDVPIIEQEAFSRYCELFYDYYKKRPYHRKQSYENGFVAPPQRPYKHSDGSYSPPCFRELVARHLDPNKPHPYWLALRFGKMTNHNFIDFDNKSNVLGHYQHDGQSRPVVRMPLSHFLVMKRIYDAFPNRIWCVSSATMGLHIWEKHLRLRTPEMVERRIRPRLEAIGQGDIEVYPSPQLINQAVRRPFGDDYYTITDDGLLTCWQDQVEYFDTATTSPRFSSIVRVLLGLLQQEWRNCRFGGKMRPKAVSPYISKYGIHIDELIREANEVVQWAKSGFRVENVTTQLVVKEEHEDKPAKSTFRNNQASRHLTDWSWEKIKDLAKNGVPEENLLFQYLLLLARPLLWRDYYGETDDIRISKTKADLLFWVENKHNGRVSRISNGDIANIKHEISQQIHVAMNNTSNSLIEFYQTMRDNDRQYPQRVERLADIIRDKEMNTSSSLVCCKCINKECDDSPLPNAIGEVISGIVVEKRMRRRNGMYPFERFSRRLLNALWCDDGVGRLSRGTLLGFCNSKNPNQIVAYKKLLAENHLIYGDWQDFSLCGIASALYRLTKWSFDAYQDCYGTEKVMRAVELRREVSVEQYERLESIEWSW